MACKGQNSTHRCSSCISWVEVERKNEIVLSDGGNENELKNERTLKGKGTISEIR